MLRFWVMKEFAGGPGSQKGVLIEELVKEFDFMSVNVEDIVFNYLPNKLANTVENSVEIQELLKVSITICHLHISTYTLLITK